MKLIRLVHFSTCNTMASPTLTFSLITLCKLRLSRTWTYSTWCDLKSLFRILFGLASMVRIQVTKCIEDAVKPILMMILYFHLSKKSHFWFCLCADLFIRLLWDVHLSIRAFLAEVVYHIHSFRIKSYYLSCSRVECIFRRYCALAVFSPRYYIVLLVFVLNHCFCRYTVD